MKPVITEYTPANEFFFEEGCYILEMHSRDDDPALSIARCRVPVGVATHWHKLHGITERYLITEGEGRVEVGDTLKKIVRAGDSVLIPPGVAQRITNTGSGELVFLAMCTPRFDVAAFEDMET
ncbi:MAG: cupin domain-containing protein [Gammaproteobacteria bacterium]|nr:MAG: cupin domain-containing protein [Gammaproteobacteria bacterium]